MAGYNTVGKRLLPVSFLTVTMTVLMATWWMKGRKGWRFDCAYQYVNYSPPSLSSLHPPPYN
ncbi:MAG: hypothetical protein M1445_09815 [Bacteroidetes bacterium]|nr:hypothetical protein [Bacteroidota bacterium]